MEHAAGRDEPPDEQENERDERQTKGSIDDALILTAAIPSEVVDRGRAEREQEPPLDRGSEKRTHKLDRIEPEERAPDGDAHRRPEEKTSGSTSEHQDRKCPNHAHKGTDKDQNHGTLHIAGAMPADGENIRNPKKCQ
jgi:hypothetical protein